MVAAIPVLFRLCYLDQDQSMGTFKQDGWYRRKLHSHFDTPLSFESAKEYVSDAVKVAQHPFLPFLSFSLEKRRIHKKPKSRPIKYASHVDGYCRFS